MYIINHYFIFKVATNRNIAAQLKNIRFGDVRVSNPGRYAPSNIYGRTGGEAFEWRLVHIVALIIMA